MGRRNYNVFFNTHTVSGIIISIALYVIFFAGAFSLFKEEIQFWEEGKPLSYTERQNINFNKLLDNLNDDYELKGRDIQMHLGKYTDHIYVYLSPSKDTTSSKKGKVAHYFYTDIKSGSTQTYNQQYSLGEFLYRLHFFYQIPTIGLYLAGLVSFFFLFAIITGVIVHWKKIIPDFFNFNPKTILKKVWADAHTALGVIGLPFQFIFALTGTYFALGILVLIPAKILYNGNQEKLLENLQPAMKNHAWVSSLEENIPNFNAFIKKANSQWDNFNLNKVYIKNYEGSNMKYIVTGELDSKKRFIGTGLVSYHVKNKQLEIEKNPYNPEYIVDIQRAMEKLHFGDFGSLSIKIIYFILALITCFVIITGVLIWVEARNKKSMNLKQRLYTAKVGHIYIAVCLSLLPVTALAFLFVKVTSGYLSNKQNAIYYFYFLTWLLFTLFYRFKRDNYFTNKSTLLLGGVFGILVPISNGIISGNWIWISFINKQYDILLVDLIWVTISSLSLLSYSKIKPNVKTKSSYHKTPIDYKNLKTLIEKDIAKNNTDLQKKTINNTKNHIPMRIKISLLWIFIAIGFIFHHIYGLATIYFKESLLMEGATGETPFWAHQWRILMEGLALTFGLLSLEISKKWFVWTSLIWSVILGIFNVYHVITAIIYEASNISEILILVLLVVANTFLVKAINNWRNS